VKASAHAASDHEREPMLERALVEAARGGRDPGRVRAGHDPDGLLVAKARGGDEPGARTERPRGAPALVEAGDPPPVACDGGVDAAGARAALEQPERLVVAQVRPRADHDAQRLEAARPAHDPARGRDAAVGELARHAIARPATRLDAFHAHGQATPVHPVQEGLREGADDGLDVRGDAPVVAVPPDLVAVVELRGGRALVGLDAVDVVEPVERAPVAPAARQAVDRLHEAAAVSGADLRVALQQAHHGVRALDLGPVERDHGPGAEIARDRQPRVRRAAARAHAAARERGDEGDGGERCGRGAPHRTWKTTRVRPRSMSVALPARSRAWTSRT
jgi:hypothetical protein